MEIVRDGITLTHLCSGYMQMSYSPKKKFFECVELKDSGYMVLIGETNDHLLVKYCPFCGKESIAHAALIEQDVVRMVEHAI